MNRNNTFCFFVIEFSKSYGLIFKHFPAFTITGFAPTSKIASTVATKVCDWVITSSPSLDSDFRAVYKAAVPELTQTEVRDLNILIFDSQRSNSKYFISSFIKAVRI